MPEVRMYHHLLTETREPFGTRVGARDLPPWLHVTITEDADSKWLTVYSRIHVRKEVMMQPTFGTEFSDFEILRQLSPAISRAFL